jgi:hypothetical protein
MGRSFDAAPERVICARQACPPTSGIMPLTAIYRGSSAVIIKTGGAEAPADTLVPAKNVVVVDEVHGSAGTGPYADHAGGRRPPACRPRAAARQARPTSALAFPARCQRPSDRAYPRRRAGSMPTWGRPGRATGPDHHQENCPRSCAYGSGEPPGTGWPGEPGRLCDSGGAGEIGGAEYRGRDKNRSRAARASQE